MPRNLHLESRLPIISSVYRSPATSTACHCVLRCSEEHGQLQRSQLAVALQHRGRVPRPLITGPLINRGVYNRGVYWVHFRSKNKPFFVPVQNTCPANQCKPTETQLLQRGLESCQSRRQAPRDTAGCNLLSHEWRPWPAARYCRTEWLQDRHRSQGAAAEARSIGGPDHGTSLGHRAPSSAHEMGSSRAATPRRGPAAPCRTPAFPVTQLGIRHSTPPAPSARPALAGAQHLLSIY